MKCSAQLNITFRQSPLSMILTLIDLYPMTSSR